jgi:hypothetical protein
MAAIVEEARPRRPAQRRLLTVRQSSEAHPAFSQSSLRWIIFNRSENGFSAALVRVGRCVLIDEHRFFEWIDSQNPEGRAP